MPSLAVTPTSIAALTAATLVVAGCGLSAPAQAEPTAPAPSAAKLERLTAFAGERGRQAFKAVDDALAALERYTNAKLVADWLVLQL